MVDDDDNDAQLTRFNQNRQTLLHPRRAPRAPDLFLLPGRHIAQQVPAGGPLGAERAAALHVGFVGSEHDDQVVVAAWKRMGKSLLVSKYIGRRAENNMLGGGSSEGGREREGSPILLAAPPCDSPPAAHCKIRAEAALRI